MTVGNTTVSCCEKDCERFQCFLNAWEDGTLTKSDSVYAAAEKSSQRLCSKFGLSDYACDMTQDTVMALAKGQYKGSCPLNAYIQIIQRNKLTEYWGKAGKGMVGSLDDEDIDLFERRTFEMAREIFLTMLSEKHMRMAMESKLPALLMKIIDVILECEGEKLFSEREMVAELQKRYPKDNFTRYQVNKHLKRLKSIITSNNVFF